MLTQMLFLIFSVPLSYCLNSNVSIHRRPWQIYEYTYSIASSESERCLKQKMRGNIKKKKEPSYHVVAIYSILFQCLHFWPKWRCSKNLRILKCIIITKAKTQIHLHFQNNDRGHWLSSSVPLKLEKVIFCVFKLCMVCRECSQVFSIRRYESPI